MASRSSFPPGASEEIGFYVYMLLDPRTSPPTPFYVGKGQGNRIFAHLNQALESSTENLKLDRIREINAAGHQVSHLILRHGLDSEEMAYEIESALIDYLSLGAGSELANRMGGHHARDRGLMSVEDVVAEYSAPEAVISEPAILIKINRLYRRGMSPEQLYEATRQSWVISEANSKRAAYVFAVAFGIIRQVYRVHNWYLVDGSKRRAFNGEVAPEMAHYLGHSIANQFSMGAQNPIRYVNCSPK